MSSYQPHAVIERCDNGWIVRWSFSTKYPSDGTSIFADIKEAMIFIEEILNG